MQERSATKLAPWLVGYVAAVHAVWAALLVMSAQAQLATPVFGLSRVFGPRLLVAALLGVSSVLVGWLLISNDGKVSVTTYLRLLPQQFLLMFSAIESTRASVLQQYSDGVTRPWAFITADQMPSILIAVFHTVIVFLWGKQLLVDRDAE